ncbi:hypothetical protein O6H91_18G049700 [Diphasiastrum complanatum]|uniref:Uncharacterized protein n=1 Tax=Diphasiastrum complanatum TaxID=34168 RepID=A0ACC2B0T9_DIPCM|nr:hypothetical protein O6H91_18G049700 [Diphasiastrum complanatum]
MAMAMAMAMARARQRGMAWLLVACLLLLVLPQCMVGEEVQGASTLLSLSDANFEHDTQAATGQTTGAWLILFVSPDCQKCIDIEESLLKDLAPSEGSPILAKVNISESPRTSKRFNVTETPNLKLFRDRRMFSYQGDWSSNDLLDFAKTGWGNVGAEDVPKDSSATDEIFKSLHNFYWQLLQILADHPGILAGVASIVAMGGYAVTRKFLVAKTRRPGPVSRKHGVQRKKTKKAE